jgi:GrpB-like predicted nucleotidyltransferase (UPF0157 family)
MHTSSPIVVVSYDPAWPLQYEAEKSRILAVIAPYVVCMEHMGSTAVPGLAAKPVIDILIGVRSLSDAPHFLPPLVSLGYDYIQKHEAVFPERRYLHRQENGQHTHHLHMVEPDSNFFKVQIAFRDYMRLHPEARDEYASLKLDLAQKFRHDREAYTDAKSAFINAILELAEKESEAQTSLSLKSKS